MVRPSKMEEVLTMSDEQRAELRKECHARVASAARNSDPPVMEDLLVLDWLDIVFDNMEVQRGQVQEADAERPDQTTAHIPDQH